MLSSSCASLLARALTQCNVMRWGVMTPILPHRTTTITARRLRCLREFNLLLPLSLLLLSSFSPKIRCVSCVVWRGYARECRGWVRKKKKKKGRVESGEEWILYLSIPSLFFFPSPYNSFMPTLPPDRLNQSHLTNCIKSIFPNEHI